MKHTHEQIAQLLAGRTQGEWATNIGADYSLSVETDETTICSYVYRADAEFIAAAPDIVAQLMAENERLRTENNRLNVARIMLKQLTGLRDWMAEGYSINQYQAFCSNDTLPDAPARSWRDESEGNGDE